MVGFLPDPLLMLDGTRVADAAGWLARGRPETLRLFSEHVYGAMPGPPPVMRTEWFDDDAEALNGRAVRRQATISFGDSPGSPSMDLLLYLPKDARQPCPLFVGLNFNGNHTVHADPAIRLSDRWMREGAPGVVEHRATEASRGSAASRWPLDLILARGYALATVYCGDLDPDYDDGFRNGVHPLFPGRDGSSWATIGAWAWGLSRAVDCLVTVPEIDPARLCVVGHSRLGKTALWAGANDPRFALVVSNDSGCGGASLSRRREGETVAAINRAFPHWFCGNFHRYSDAETQLPIDQHQLIALMAPRPVYVASATEDGWADPRGEYLSAWHAGPVYRLFHRQGLPAEASPPPDTPVGGTVRYHLRTGAHDITAWDWTQYLNAADELLPGRQPWRSIGP